MSEVRRWRKAGYLPLYLLFVSCLVVHLLPLNFLLELIILFFVTFIYFISIHFKYFHSVANFAIYHQISLRQPSVIQRRAWGDLIEERIINNTITLSSHRLSFTLIFFQFICKKPVRHHAIKLHVKEIA